MKDNIRKILKEEGDFDWAIDTKPTDRKDIEQSLRGLSSIGDYETNISGLVDIIHGFGLSVPDSDKLFVELHDIMYQLHGDAHSEGHDSGYRDGEVDTRYKYDDSIYEAKQEAYDEGKMDGEYEGHDKGYDEGIKDGYKSGFEEGRTYEYDGETEETEKRGGSPYDPSEYDDDYSDEY